MTLSKKRRRELRKNGTLDTSDKIPQKGMNLINVDPMTWNQQLTFDSYREQKNLLLHGLAGTGKTFISLYLALEELFYGNPCYYNNITIIRSVVPTRDIGFLPGNEHDKIGVYEAPYENLCNELFNRGDAYGILKHKELIHFTCTSFIRGLTLRNTIVIVDEVQNMNYHELASLITRLGDNCRILLCGDFRQSDLTREKERRGLHDFISVVDRIEDFDHIEFLRDDIVRSKLVKNFIIAQDELGICA